MYEIHVKGKKTAVLLVLANAVGFYEPEITFEQGDADRYVVHCEIETKWDVNPFGDTGKPWDGSKADLSAYPEEKVQNGDYLLCFEEYGAKYLSGFLDVQIEMLNRPDDSDNPFCNFTAYASGKTVEISQFSNPDFTGDEPDDMDPEELADLFDEWHEFHF